MGLGLALGSIGSISSSGSLDRDGSAKSIESGEGGT